MTNSRISELQMGSTSLASVDPPKRSKSLTAVIVVILILVGLFAYVGKDHFLPAVEVTVERAMAVKGTTQVARSGELAFQSAGWLEPAPFAVRAPALVDGVVKKIYFLEGDSVKKDELIAELINEDILLDIAENEALKVQAVQRQKEIEAEVSEVAAQHTRQHAIVESEKRRLVKLEEIAATLAQSGEAIPKLDRITAKHNAEIQRATVDQAEAEVVVLVQAELVAKGKLEVQKAAVDLIGHKAAKLALSLKRTKIYSPINGIIKRVVVYDGSVVNLDSDSADAGLIAELFDPAKLQVRVDVPLSDAAGLSVGQEANVKVELLPNTIFKGIVSSIAGRADINRNTLQAKVKVIKPDAKLRPEMLAKVQFLSVGSSSTDNAEGTSESTQIFIPESSIENDNSIWIIDRLTRKAELINVTLGQAKKDNWVEVVSGVNAGQQVIVSDTSSLEPGMRVKVLK